jgi:hypothetical protein
VAIADLQPRTVARVEGRIVAIQIEPAGAAPTLIAHVEDATGRLDAVFMGRRGIDGIEPGCVLALEGRVCVAQGRSRMYNPRYELQWRD